jgi:hypothetical protein
VGDIMLSPVFLIVDAEDERLLTVPNIPSSVTSVVDTIKGAVESFRSKPEKNDKEE